MQWRGIFIYIYICLYIYIGAHPSRCSPVCLNRYRAPTRPNIYAYTYMCDYILNLLHGRL